MCSCVIVAKSVSLIFFISSYLVDRKSGQDEADSDKKTAENICNVSKRVDKILQDYDLIIVDLILLTIIQVRFSYSFTNFSF